MRRVLIYFTTPVAFFASTITAIAAESVPNPTLEAMQQVVSGLYTFSLKFVGLCVFIMFIIAGLAYVIPESMRPALMKDPIDIMKNAVIGFLLLVSAFLILNSINPDLVTFRSS